MVASLIGQSPVQGTDFSSPACRMDPFERQNLALHVLGGHEPVSHLASRHQVSRPFCYRQAARAREALNQAFASQEPDSTVLYHLPITKDWIRQFVLGLTLVGHSSDRAVIELLKTLTGYDGLSIGTVHNILMQAAQRARELNQAQDLRGINAAALDEIYQAGHPVLAGVDLASTYCFLLSQEESCDATTWGVRLLELSEGGKLDLDYSVADGGWALRLGQKEAWPNTPCLGDVFHPEREISKVVGYLQNRAKAAREARESLDKKCVNCVETARIYPLGIRRGKARREEAGATALAQDIALLGRWMREDVLEVAGEPLEVRQELYDFLMAELRARESLCPHRLTGLRKALENQRDQLLGFVAVLDAELDELKERLGAPPHLVRAMVRLEALDRRACLYWQRRGELMGKLGGLFGTLEQAVKAVLSRTHRASSLVENLNSRLRCYFFLRRQLSQPYLDLLRFYLNHHCFERSRCPERVGKSPWGLLSGQEHPHWLEMLGHSRVHPN